MYRSNSHSSIQNLRNSKPTTKTTMTSPTPTPTSPTLTSTGIGPVIQVTKVLDGLPRPDSRSQSTPPPEVRTDNESGVEDGALELAKQFMSTMGNLARKCHSRGALSELYLTTLTAWASPEVQADESLQRHFKQVLFAIAHGMKLVRVRDQGRSLFWNRYRDNTGNQLEDERAKYTARQQDRRGGQDQYRDDRRGGQDQYRDDRRGGQDQYRDDRRGGQDQYRDDRRGAQDQYRDDRRGGQHQYREDRRGGQHQYRDDRRGGQHQYRDDRRGGQHQYRDDRRGGQHQYRDDRRGDQGERRSGTPDSKGWIAAGGNSRSHHRNV